MNCWLFHLAEHDKKLILDNHISIWWSCVQNLGATDKTNLIILSNKSHLLLNKSFFSLKKKELIQK